MMHNHVRLMQFFSDVQTVSGRKKLQKMVYILQACGVPFEEKFVFHKFGPYSEELTLRMEELCNLGFISETKVDKSNYTQYDYFVTDDGAEFLDQFAMDMPDLKPYVNRLKNESARFLELVATMLYFRDHSREEIEMKIHTVKPKQKYTQSEFEKARQLIGELPSK